MPKESFKIEPEQAIAMAEIRPVTGVAAFAAIAATSLVLAGLIALLAPTIRQLH